MAVHVSEHGVTTPAADDADCVGVAAGEEQGHSATVAQGASGDVRRMDTAVAGNGQGS